MSGIAMDGLPRSDGIARSTAAIAVAIELRKVCRGDVQAQAMPNLEAVGGASDFDLQAIDAARLEQLRFAIEITITRTQDTALQLNCASVGENITEAGHEIGIGNARACIESQAQRTHHVQVLSQRLGGVDDHIRTALGRAHVDAAGRINE
jgi:hypothetical protein